MADRTYIPYDEFPTEYQSISYKPDNMDENEDSPFTWEDFCRETLGNLTYAEELCARAEWAFPSTMIDEDMREEHIMFDDDGTLVIVDEDTGEEQDAYYDPDLFDQNSVLGL